MTAVGVTTARGADTFAYDQANRLTQATVAGVTETSTYDGDGVRATRQVGAGPLTRYVTDPAAGLPVTIDDGSRKYVWGLGLAYAVTGSAIEVYHTDRLGSVRALTDAAGTVTATYRSDEFGIPAGSTGSSGQPFRYTGEPSDTSGLTYLRARFYDSSIGRFMSRDPFAGSGAATASLNRFAYAANNPTGFVDPSGHWLNVVIGGVIGGITGGAGSLVGDFLSGQPPDLGRAAIATLGGTATGAVCGATLGVACLVTGAATSVVQYQTTPGATNPVEDPSAYALIATSGAILGRATGGAVLTRNPVWFGSDLISNPIRRVTTNYPGWRRAVGFAFAKSLTASITAAIESSLLNPPVAAAASRVLKPGQGRRL